MLLAYRVAGRAHIEQHAAILKQRGCRVVGQIFFDALGQLFSGGAASSPAAIRGPTSPAARADW